MMNNVDHDQLIERFLNGAMGHSEEQEFKSLITNDRELSRLLNAERIIKSAVAVDLARAAAPGPASFQRFETMLNKTVVPATSGVSISANAHVDNSKRSTWLRRIMGIALLLLVGTVLFVMLQPNAKMDTPSNRSIESAPGTGTSTRMDGGTGVNAEAPKGTAVESARKSFGTTTPGSDAKKSAKQSKSASTQMDGSSSTNAKSRAATTTNRTTTDVDPRTPPSETPPTITNPEVKGAVGVGKDKKP